MRDLAPYFIPFGLLCFVGGWLVAMIRKDFAPAVIGMLIVIGLFVVAAVDALISWLISSTG